MELKIGRNSFLAEIQKIQNITPIKGTKPILSCFLLETTEEGICLYATDLNVGMKVSVQADISVHGKVCLPARVVYEILRELPDNSSIDLLLEENNRLRFTCMNSLFHVPSVDTEEFPEFPLFDMQQMYPIPLDILVDMFDKVNIAVPDVEQKLYGAPAGALFAVDSTGTEMAGTDGLRMAYVHTDELKLPVQVTKVLPKKLLNELPKILPDLEKNKEKASEDPDKKGAIDIGLTENHIVFSWPNSVIFALLLENKFPDYKEPISVKNDKVIILDRDRFRQTVRRVSLLSEKKDWFIRFKLNQGKFFLDSENVGIGDAHDEMDVDYNGEDVDIGFNPRYVLDALSVIDTPEVSLEMRDNESLAILRPKDQENVKFIIMPVRL